jgi:hypothetical protein
MIVGSFNCPEGSGKTRGGGRTKLVSREDPAKDQSHAVPPEDLGGKRHRRRYCRDPIEAVKNREQW